MSSEFIDLSRALEIAQRDLKNLQCSIKYSERKVFHASEYYTEGFVAEFLKNALGNIRVAQEMCRDAAAKNMTDNIVFTVILERLVTNIIAAETDEDTDENMVEVYQRVLQIVLTHLHAAGGKVGKIMVLILPSCFFCN